MQALKFFNFSNEDFSYTWDGERYDFPAGEVTRLPEYLARHFAKHLVDRELQKQKLEVNHFSRPEYMAKALPGADFIQPEVEEVAETSEQKVMVEIMNEKPQATRKRAKKAPVVEAEEPKEEVEFPDLAK